MAFGIATFRPDGSTMMNGLTAGGVLIDVISIPAGSSGSKTYPRVSSTSSLEWRVVRGKGISLSTSITGGGVKLSWAFSAGDARADVVLYVFASTLVSADLYGVLLNNDAGQVLADQGYPSPQYVGTINPSTTPDLAYLTPDGYTAIVHSTSAVNLRSASDRMVLMAIPDSGNDDTWYTLQNEYLEYGNTSGIKLTVYTKAATYKLPSLHLYALNNPQPSANNYGLRIYDASSSLTFDSSYECLNNQSSLNFNYPAADPYTESGGGTQTYTLGSSGVPGLSLPYYSVLFGVNSYNRKFVGATKKVGSQVTVRNIFDSKTALTTSVKEETGGQVNRYCPVADITYQNPYSVTLNKPTSVYTYPTVVRDVGNNQINPGQTAVFTFEVTGTPAPTYQWYKNSVLMPGQTSASYYLSGSNGDQVYCIATNVMGSVRSMTGTLYVNNLVGATITSTTGPNAANVGDTVTFSMTGSGSPTPYCSISVPGRGLVGAYGSVSTTFVVTADNFGTVTFSADNKDGAYGQTATSNKPFSVIPQAKPVITTQPTSISVSQGAGSSLSCFSSTSGVSYQWLSYPGNSVVGGGTSFSPSTATVGTFYYYCRVSLGGTNYTDSSIATVTVTSGPAATYPSYNNFNGIRNASGSNATFEIYSNGSSSTGSWANGSGDGGLYSVSATGTFTPATNSFGLGTTYDFSQYGGVGWIAAKPASGTVTYYLNVTVKLKSTGATVATGVITMNISA